MLAGLGRVEMVQLLYAENADREFTPGPIETMVARTGEALALLNSRLDITRNQSGVITAFTLTYPGGMRYVYEFFRTDNLGAWDQVYLTQRISRHGYAITVDVKNQLVSTPYGTCAYDNNGNLTGDGGTRTFSYDDENRLSQVFWGNGTYRTDFAYDGRDRLRTRRDHYWTGSTWSLYGETRYLYDGMLLIQERTSANKKAMGSDTPCAAAWYFKPSICVSNSVSR